MTVDTMEITSRQKVFEVIRKHQLVTVSELSHFLEMTPANIRHHLAALKADGLVERIESRKKTGRGRPEVVYSVSHVFVKDGLETLVDGILKLWLSSKSPEEMDQHVHVLASHLAGDGKSLGNIPINKKLTTCMVILNDMHYKAKWEASPSGPRLKFGNCPYRKIIDRHPELCLLDKYLLEELLGIKITQISKLERDERGKLYCSFVAH